MIKKIIRLSAIWIIKILFAPSHFKVSIFKRLYYACRGGYTPDQIYLYKLNKKNKDQYLSEFDWYKSRYINAPYNFILDNKVVCSEILKKYINVPKIYIIKEKNKLLSKENNIKDYNDIIKLIKEKKVIYIKPNGKGKGTGVSKIEYYNKLFYYDEKEVTVEKLSSILSNRQNYHLCEGIKQAKYLDNIYDKTTNTIRLITLRDPNNDEYIVYSAVQRIGTEKTIPVDNGSRGGLVSKIDIDTGKLSAAKSIQDDIEYNNHPNSNEKIKNIIIPNWNNIKKEILNIAKEFPYLHFIAWDILATERGIYVIEANSSSGLNILQIWGGERKKILGEFYKKNNIIKK